MSREHALLDALADLGIATTIHEHEAMFTVEASAKLHTEIAGAHTKNLFLKDAGGQFWLVTAPHDARIDLKALPIVIGSKKLSFGKSEDMQRILGVMPGSVTPLAAFNDVQCELKVVIDARLTTQIYINVHPLRNTATISLPAQGLIAFLAKHEHAPLITELPTPQ